MSVICNQSKICRMRHECGGAKPHDRCNECGNCHFNKEENCEKISNQKDKRSQHG